MAAQLRRSLAVVAASLIGVVSPVAAETRPGYGGAVVGTLLGEPAAVDPVDAREHAELTLIGLVFDTLYRNSADGAIAPHVAAALPLVTGNRARIAIRPGAVFHDGSSLDAADVAASLRRLSKSDAGWILASVTSIEVVGDAVDLVLAAPTPDLAALLALPQASITPGGDAPRARAPIGSGPFRVASIDRRRQRIALRAFDGHFAGRPYLDELELRWPRDSDAEARLFETGGAQLSQRGATVFAGHQPKFAAGEVESPATLLVYVGFGRAHAAVTGHREFRRALHLVLARGGFASVGTGERIEPAVDPVPAELGGQVPAAARTGDLAAARAALARAAAAVPALRSDRLAQLRLDILIDESRPDDRVVAERLVRDLDKLGIAARITAASAAQVRARRGRGELDLVVGQLVMASPSPGIAWATAFAAGDSSWARHALARGAVDPAAARAEHERALPIVPLYHRAIRVHHRLDVRGLAFDGAARLGFADLFLFGAPVRTAGTTP